MTPAARTPARNVLAVLVLLVVAVSALTAVPGGQAAAAASTTAVAGPRPHHGLVPQVPARGYPVISTLPGIRATSKKCPDGCDRPREVLGTDQVGRYIVSGGNFLNVELQDGTSLEQPYFTAWNIDTKVIACVGLTFDAPVLKVLPGVEQDVVFVAGRFTKVTDRDGVTRTRSKVAKLDLSDCSVDRTFRPPAPNGKLDELALVGDRLFVGGDFSQLGGRAQSTVAELDARTGAVRPDFSLSFSGGLSSRLRGMAVTGGGGRLVLAGRFGTVTQGDTSVTMPTAVVDITGATPRLTPHSSVGYTTSRGGEMPMKALQDASVSPDGSSVGLAFGTGTVYDYVYYAPLTEAPDTHYTWRHYMRDSSFGIGVSNNAVYVTGHFCKPDAGPGPSEVLEPVAGITKDCTGSRMDGGVWRSKLAALSPVDGTPLAWNPGNGSFRGGQVVTVTTRGLLIGFDGQRTAGVRTGALSFLDLGVGAEDGAAPSEVHLVSPAEGATVGTPVAVEGTAVDDTAIASFLLSVRDDEGRYLQPDGSFGAAVTQRTVEARVGGVLRTDLSLPVGSFTLSVVAVDVAGRQSAQATTRSFVQDGVDRSGPVVTVAAPRSLDADEPLTIGGTARDAGDVVSIKPRVQAADGRWLQADNTFSSDVSNLPVSTDVPLPATSVSYSVDAELSLPAGDYTVMTRVLDAAGNASTVYQDLAVASVDPVVTITSPDTQVTAGRPVDLAGSVEDAGGVAGVEVLLADQDGAFLQPDGSFAGSSTPLAVELTGLGTAAASWSYRTGGLRAGPYTLTVSGRDASGRSTTTQRTFTARAAATAGVLAHTGGSATRSAGTVGFTFRVARPRTVRRIAVQDVNGNGRLDNRSAVLASVWRRGARRALATVRLPAGAPASDGWAWARVARGLRLEPGTTYVVAHQVLRRGEPYFRTGRPSVVRALRITGRATYLPRTGGGYRYPSSQRRGASPYGVPNLWLQP